MTNLECLKCGQVFEIYDKLKTHLRCIHEMTMGEYRLEYGVARQAHNRKYENLRMKVRCHICLKEFEVETRWYEMRIKQGKNRFACPSDIKGKRSECCKKLQAITIGEVRGSIESRAKTAEATKEMWATMDKDRHIRAMKDGMSNSKAYANRNNVAKETRDNNRKIDPDKYSKAMKLAWDTRGRPEWHEASFDCASCGKHTEQKLPPARFLNKFTKEPRHFCSPGCQKEYNSAHTKFRDTKIELKVKEFLLSFNIVFVPQKVIYFNMENRPQRWTVVDFLVKDNIVIYVDGCYFHACPTCGLKCPEIGVFEHDKEVTKALESMGYAVIRIWGHELQDPAWQAKLLTKINSFLPA
jgi:G:T-mismatch repair DNA endonuclease (very short patch repair protein)